MEGVCGGASANTNAVWTSGLGVSGGAVDKKRMRAGLKQKGIII